MVFASSGAAWFAIGNDAAIAANSGACQSKGIVSAILLPVQTNHLLCLTATRSPLSSKIAQTVSKDKDSEVALPPATPLTKELPAALTPVSQLRRANQYIPHLAADVELVPPRESKPAGNVISAEQSDGESHPEVQQTFPQASPEFQPVLTVDKLDVPRLDGNSELGVLRVRKLEVQPQQINSSSELGILRVRELEVQSSQTDNAADSELGVLRVRELEVQPRQAQGDSELGTLRVRELEVEPLQTDSDLELGNLRIRGQELKTPQELQSPPYQTTARLLAQVGYFQTNNIFSGIDPVDDSLLSLGLTLWATPALGPKTTLVAAIDGSLIRYVDRSESSYNQARFRASIRQQLTPQMYGEIGWNNQQLFRAGVGDRFLDENSVRLAFQRRDRLSDKLRLNTLYEFRFSDANPETRSRIINSLSVFLSYYLKRNLQVGLDYQFGISNFTQSDRQDQYHRLLGRLNYALSPDSQVSVQGGLTSGGSSRSDIDFDNFFFSITYTVELGKF